MECSLYIPQFLKFASFNILFYYLHHVGCGDFNKNSSGEKLEMLSRNFCIFFFFFLVFSLDLCLLYIIDVHTKNTWRLVVDLEFSGVFLFLFLLWRILKIHNTWRKYNEPLHTSHSAQEYYHMVCPALCIHLSLSSSPHYIWKKF